MALIVEDGTGKADADSYIDLVAAREFAEKYGVTLPVDDAACEVALRQGTQYVDLQELSFGGTRAGDTQALSFPRTSYTSINGIAIAAYTAPKQLGYATVFAAAEYASGTDVRGNDGGQAVASEEVTGAVKVSYFDNGQNGSTTTITRAIDALKPLYSYSHSVGGIEFRVGR